MKNSSVSGCRHVRSSVYQGLAIVALAATGVSQAQSSTAEPSFVPGRILLLPMAGLPDSQLAHTLAGAGAWGARRVTSHGLHIAEVPEGTEAAAVARLAHNPNLKLVALDHRVAPAMVTNDPYLGSAWQLTRIGATKAWDSTSGGGVTIAILDSGVDPLHPDLQPNLVAGWNFYDGNANTADVYGHGTKVAGAAVAAANNGIGGAGVAPGAKLMPLRVTDTSGMGTVSAIAQALSWAADHGARVANVSFLVAGNSTIQSAAQYMRNKGGAVFVSGGNSGAYDATAPSDALIAVSSTESNDTVSSFSSYGSYIDISAPGGSIYTTINGGGYGPASGTSFASPVAAGTAALLFAARPALTPKEVESVMKSTAVDLGAAGTDAHFGAGRIDAAAALSAVLSSSGSVTTDTTAPTAAITSPASSTSVAGVVTIGVSAADKLGVVRVELLVNGAMTASDITAPFGFVWDSTGAANGMVSLAVKAFDAAGNSGTSATVLVNIANASALDSTPPAVTIQQPTGGTTISGMAAVAGLATDNLGSSGVTQTLSIDGKIVATAAGGSLGYNWNTKRSKVGSHLLTLVAKDKAGNASTVTESVIVGR